MNQACTVCALASASAKQEHFRAGGLLSPRLPGLSGSGILSIHLLGEHQ